MESVGRFCPGRYCYAWRQMGSRLTARASTSNKVRKEENVPFHALVIILSSVSHYIAGQCDGLGSNMGGGKILN